jgi:hypothetical protein
MEARSRFVRRASAVTGLAKRKARFAPSRETKRAFASRTRAFQNRKAIAPLDMHPAYQVPRSLSAARVIYCLGCAPARLRLKPQAMGVLLGTGVAGTAEGAGDTAAAFAAVG